MEAQLNHFTKIIIIILFCSSLLQVRSEEYYIKANSTDLCTVPCQLLDQVIANFSDLFSPNDTVTLVFNPGTHYLSVNATIINISNLLMSSKSENLTTRIICKNYAWFIFEHLNNIHISNLEFIGCGGNQVVNVDYFVIHETVFRGQENSGTGIELINTTAEIVNCTFSSHKNGKRINR